MISLPITSFISRDMTLPGDKSISHRALILAAISEGTTHIQNCLASLDCLATARALENMGVKLVWHEHDVFVDGVGRYGLSRPNMPIDCGNSGTSMRLLAGLLSGQKFDSLLIGDASLSKRPMMRIVTPLRQMGAEINLDNGCAPIQIIGRKALQAIAYAPPIASAQVKSCVLLAGLYTALPTTVHETQLTRDHTERMLPFFLDNTSSENRVFKVPGDLSSAAFFIVLASLTKNAVLTMRGVGVNPTRMGIIEILKTMGADIKLANYCFYGAEPVADITVRYAPLKGVLVSHEVLVRAIDEFPILLIAAAKAEGETRILGVGELRHKESDMVAVMLSGLSKLGISVTVQDDVVTIQGGVLSGGEVDAASDHRIAMAFLIAGAVAKDGVRVLNTDAISTSFPSFLHEAEQLGCLVKP